MTLKTERVGREGNLDMIGDCTADNSERFIEDLHRSLFAEASSAVSCRFIAIKMKYMKGSAGLQDVVFHLHAASPSDMTHEKIFAKNLAMSDSDS